MTRPQQCCQSNNENTPILALLFEFPLYKANTQHVDFDKNKPLVILNVDLKMINTDILEITCHLSLKLETENVKVTYSTD
jgi:hypothetical protein